MTTATIPADDLKAERRPYQPFGTAEEFLYRREPEVVLAGPAGTGKSRACLEKLHLCATKYPGMRGLIVRKTRESLSETALVTFEDKVIPAGHSCLAGPSRRNRQVYRYPNKSSIVVGGMDKPSKVMSSEYDIIFVQEAIELSEHEWETLTTRLRNGVMPYQQIVADTNPDTPLHWLRLRANSGRTVMLDSRHEDNPILWDRFARSWTPAGATYIDKLDNLTGPRKARLRDGKWVQAEGLVYDGWDRSIHLVYRFPIPLDWPRFWVVDFGYTNPFVWQAWAQDPDGRLYRYREIYLTHRLVEDHAKAILSAVQDQSGRWTEPKPQAIICDHDAEDRATLERHLKMTTQPAKKDVSPGIQSVASRLKVAGDGKPRLFLLRDSLEERDEALVEAKLPTCTEEEVDSYVWDTGGGRKKGEQPLKKNDHGMDGMRYMAMHFEGRPGPIQIGTPRESQRNLGDSAPAGVFGSGDPG